MTKLGYVSEQVTLGQLVNTGTILPAPFYNQIGQQLYWRRRDDGTYGGVGDPKWIYKRKLQSSTDNLNYRVAEFSESGLFVWFTSNTETNTHGSLMVYQVDGEDILGWYASFRQDTHWIVDRTKGIDKKTVDSWFPIQ